jgi:integration host factor subunit beta
VGKFTRERITEILRSGAGLKVRQARAITARIIGALAAALAAGEAVELRGLGSLEVRERGRCRSCNPKTREPVDVPPGMEQHVTAGSELKTALRVAEAPDAEKSGSGA